MATKIRLQRGGRKGYAFYRIVIADARAPRDGRFTEKIGTYNPNTDPATVDLNFDRALYWVEVGAQPTDTVRNILSNEGVYLMKHLRGGVRKGAFDEATAQKKFDAWKEEKLKGFEAVREKNAKAKKDAAAKNLEEEKKKNEEIAKKVADKKAAEVAEETPAEEAAAEETVEAPVEEPVAEEPKAEEAPVEDPKTEEAPAAEEAPAEEAPAEEPAEA
ncbi:MAG: 30S ribosomal protein S16 [Prevotella sp.]|nr:30S ribosomal protein S16 [Prevotella sp.]